MPGAAMTVPSGLGSVADAERGGIEEHAEVGQIDNRDLDGAAVIHRNGVDAVSGREDFSGEPTCEVAKINQDLSTRPRNAADGGLTSDARLSIEHIEGHVHHLSRVRRDDSNRHSSVGDARDHVLHPGQHRNARRDVPAVHFVAEARGLIGEDLNKRIVDIGVRARRGRNDCNLGL
jgi:hypothetical protein